MISLLATATLCFVSHAFGRVESGAGLEPTAAALQQFPNGTLGAMQFASSQDQSQVTLSGAPFLGGHVTVNLLPGTLDAAVAVFPSRVASLDYSQHYNSATQTYDVTAVLPNGITWDSLNGAAVWCDGCILPNEVPPFSGVVAQTVPPSAPFVNSSNVVAFVFASATLNVAPESTPTGRLLLQAVPPLPGTPVPVPKEIPGGCIVSVGNAPPESFYACAFAPTAPDVEYRWYYTLTPNGSGTTWRGGLEVAVGMVHGQWVGFGFPATPFTMIGTNAVVIRQCPSCQSGARVDGYRLTDKLPTTKVPGSFPIRDAAAAARSDGTLVATFTVDLNKSLTDLTSGTFNHVYAVGPLNSSGDLMFHVIGLYPYGGENAELKSDKSLPGANTTANTAIANPAVASDPAPSVVPPPPALVPQTEAAPMSSGSCTSMLGASPENFNACTTLENGLEMLWKIPPDLTIVGGNISFSFGLSGTVPTGRWAALGFPVVPAQMIGTTAMVLTLCSSCPGGVSLLDYYLAAQAPSAVTHPGRLAVTGTTTGLSAGGQAQAMFTVSLPASAFQGASLPILYARGPLSSSGALQQHDLRGAAIVDLSSGASMSANNNSLQAKKNAHAWLMVTGWTLILAGAVIARSFRTHGGSLWFQLHRALQVVGMTTVLAAFILIFTALGGRRTIYTTHFRLGVSATTLALAQMSALVFRPHLDSRWRRLWALSHHWIGRSAVVLSIANIYYGMINVLLVGSWAVISYSVVFGSIVLLGAVKEGLDYLYLPPPAKFKVVNSVEEAEAALVGSALGNVCRRSHAKVDETATGDSNCISVGSSADMESGHD